MENSTFKTHINWLVDTYMTKCPERTDLMDAIWELVPFKEVLKMIMSDVEPFHAVRLVWCLVQINADAIFCSFVSEAGDLNKLFEMLIIRARGARGRVKERIFQCIKEMIDALIGSTAPTDLSPVEQVCTNFPLDPAMISWAWDEINDIQMDLEDSDE